MKKYYIVICAAFLASGCSGVVTKNFKVFTDPPDASIRVVSGADKREQKYRSPADVTVDVPKEPALAAKSIVEVRKENYKPRIVPLRDISDGDTLNIKLEKMSPETARYHLTYRLTSPVVSDELKFKDKSITVSFTVGERAFKMHFENHSPFDVKILWDRAEYTDMNGQRHRLMHSGVRYQERNNPIAAQTILSRGVVEQTVIPITNVFMSQQTKGYDVRPLFPLESDAAAGLKGRSIILFIPVEIDRQIFPYNFKIEITDATKQGS
jgi:hypothetical protein